MTNAIAPALLLLANAAAIEPEKNGCTRGEGAADVYFCASGPIAALGCTALRRVKELDALGVDALECEYPFPPDSATHVAGVRPHPRDYLGPATSTTCLLIRDGSDLRLLTSRDEFVARFAPVESREEALAFAMLLTGLPRHRTSTVVKSGTAFVVRRLVMTTAGCLAMPRNADTTIVNHSDGPASRCVNGSSVARAKGATVAVAQSRPARFPARSLGRSELRAMQRV